MLRTSTMYHYLMCMLGQTVQLCWVGFQEIPGILKYTLVTEFLQSSIRFLQTDGNMYQASRIQLTVRRVVCSRLNYLIIDCGGVVPNGLLNLLPIGQNNLQLSLPDEEREVCFVAPVILPEFPLVNCFSSFMKLQRIAAWILRFCNNCCMIKSSHILTPQLTVSELITAENHWFKYAQSNDFSAKLSSLQAKKFISRSSCLFHLHPFLDSHGILRMKGRQSHSSTSYARTHPIILHGRNSITKLIIYTEHLRLLHAGPTMLLGSLTRRFNILYMRKTVHSITRGCITCRHLTTKPQPQLLGQLPLERITATSVFNKVGVDYAGPFLVKYGAVRKRATVKSYVCVFVCLAIRAVHLELVSDLTAEAFLAALRRFTARRGYPALIWSDNGRISLGPKELFEIYEFLEQQMKDDVISQFCAAKHIEWKYIPEHSHHFGGYGRLQ